ncbi:GNAT family N-acetyltransferase [Anaerosporobacter faecicola]|uniref:GNAT family N-acetyltransferase n=1 Tax=Anaerosporobacter faecicola TaxID=2718714 RepID=UPI0014391F28|nr:GNAT family protein [Anaerosporobacter faecicola]
MNFELRKWKVEDAEDVAFFANNKKIADNLRNVFPYPYTLEDALGYVTSCAENTEERQICRAIVVDGRVVGSVGIFLGNDVYEKSGEIGYWLAEQYWRKGIMSRAVGQLCKEAFERFAIERIYSEPFAYNMGSRGVLEKNGFQLEGVMRKGVCKNGKIFDYCMYSLLREDLV